MESVHSGIRARSRVMMKTLWDLQTQMTERGVRMGDEENGARGGKLNDVAVRIER